MCLPKSYRIIIGVPAALVLFSCTTPEPPPAISLRTEDVIKGNFANEHSEESSALARLEEVATYKSFKGELVKDLRIYLYAKMAAEKKDQSQAEFYWAELLRSGSKRLQQIVVEDWAIMIASQQSPSSLSTNQVIEVLQGKFRDMELKEWILRENFGANDRWVRRIGKAMSTPGVTLVDVDQKPNNLPKDLVELSRISDLDTYISIKCSEPEYDLGAASQLTKARKQYVEAALAACKKDQQVAINRLKTLVESTAESELPLRYASLKRLIQIYKSQGDRSEVSNLYASLVEQTSDLEALSESYGISTLEMAMRMIDDALWASRNRALTGHFEAAEKYAKLALVQIDQQSTRQNLTKTHRRELGLLRAEAFQILATRIAYEKGDLDSAINYLVLGRDNPELDDDWKQRFDWFLGLYHYSSGEYQGARRFWEAMLAKADDSAARARLYFWLARTYERLGMQEEKEFHVRLLLDEYPLSFYSVVGLNIAGLAEANGWQAPFQSIGKVATNLVDYSRFELEEFREDKIVSSVLLRAEIAVAAELPLILQQALIRELTEVVNKNRSKFKVENFVRMSIYISRLQLAAGMHAQSFALSSQVDEMHKRFWSEWPDQLFVLFPKPRALRTDGLTPSFPAVKESTVLAIARQESAFEYNAVSPAGAIGLMQLIPPTARRFAAELTMSFEPIEERLKEPQVNIQLGTAYLDFLRKRYGTNESAIYAAYNAGEFAVDAWLQRRKSDDILLWVEHIPFAETQGYVKNVWRNRAVYDFLVGISSQLAFSFNISSYQYL
jgi:soluble lytic murein transglycosylase-like protein